MKKLKVLRYNECIEENFNEELGMGYEKFKVNENTTLKELMKILLDIDDDYIEENYDSLIDCWESEFQEDEIYVFGIGFDDVNISSYVNEDTDFDLQIKDIVE